MNDDDKPVTKKDLMEVLGEFGQGLEQRLEQRFEQKLDARITALEERLREYVHDTETRILRAFHSFSVANDIRLGQLEDIAAASGKRISALEAAGRLAELELRVAQIEHKLDRRQ